MGKKQEVKQKMQIKDLKLLKKGVQETHEDKQKSDETIKVEEKLPSPVPVVSEVKEKTENLPEVILLEKNNETTEDDKKEKPVQSQNKTITKELEPEVPKVKKI